MKAPIQFQAGRFMARQVAGQWEFFYCYRRDTKGAHWRRIAPHLPWRKRVVRQFWPAMVDVAARGAA